jgi:thiamine biosynthesis lipoprotein ApbE
MHVPVGDVATLIEASETLVEKTEAALDGSMGSSKALHKASFETSLALPRAAQEAFSTAADCPTGTLNPCLTPAT